MARLEMIACLSGLAASTAAAQWTVTNLHPAGATASYATGVHEGQQVGYSDATGPLHACLWSGTPASWVDLNPVGATESQAASVSSGKQAGYANIGGAVRASLWNGTVASWVDLSPYAPGEGSSMVLGGGGGQQVGVHSIGGDWSRACMWSGTAASFVSLDPTWGWYSRAYSADGTQQVGWTMTGTWQATLWTGTAASAVSLHIGDLSVAYGVGGGEQVGYYRNLGQHRACLWKGTAASWTDLHPAGTEHSEAYATDGAREVGFATVGGANHASLWSGSTASWVDLHAFLPTGFRDSEARGTWSDGISIYVVGSGFNVPRNRPEALMWVGPTVCYANCDGSSTSPILNALDFGCFLNKFAAADPAANCDNSTAPPVLNVNDFMCFINRFAAGCG